LPKPAVLDSSAVLVLLQNEPGSATVGQVIHGALLSAVNLTEVHAKLIGKGVPSLISWQRVVALQCNQCSYTEVHARIAAELILVTKPYGLSLGDRACLALAIDRNATVYTTDKVWKNLSLGIEIELIR
jgi:ribonuclease VapC